MVIFEKVELKYQEAGLLNVKSIIKVVQKWNGFAFYGLWPGVLIKNDMLKGNLRYWTETKCRMDVHAHGDGQNFVVM